MPVYVEAKQPKASRAKKPLFAHMADDALLDYGVPVEWLADARAATDDTLLTLADHLPREAGEALLELATGGKPRLPQPAATVANPFEHPDARRRFRLMANVEELQRALNFPWDKWTVFLHPDQREWVERDYTGAARVSGSAGTGKTIVALHRAAHLARTHPDARVLLATFTDILASALRSKLLRLVSSEPRLAERIDVHSLDALGLRLYKAQVGPATLASRPLVRQLLRDASAAVGAHKFSDHFLLTEWEQLVDAWQLQTWEEYRDVARLGRKTRLPEAQRAVLWSIFERVAHRLEGKERHHPGSALHHPRGGHCKGQKSPLRLCGRGRGTGPEHCADAILRRPRWRTGPTPFSLPATSASGFSSNHFPGNRWASIFAAGRAPCVSTTAPRIRSACRPTCFSARKSATSTTIPKNVATPCRFSTDPRRRSVFSKTRRRKPAPLPHGWPTSRTAAFRLMKSGFSSALTPNLAEPSPRRRRHDLPYKLLDEHVETAPGSPGDQHHAPGQGPGISRRRGHGL